MINVLFVCLGNICRSPLAEEVFREITRQNNNTSLFHIDSCGVENYHIGEKPDMRMAITAKSHGLTFNHLARQFKKEDFEIFSYIIAMDQSNLKHLQRLASNNSDKLKIHSLRSFDCMGNALMDVPDPYYGEQSGFDDVYQIVFRSCENLYAYTLKKNLL